MKPHEQTWTLEERPSPRVLMGPKGMAPGGSWPALVAVHADREDVLEALRLAHAAPDMARALVRLLWDGGHAGGCRGVRVSDGECMSACAIARTALAKAGVPLP